MYVERYMKCLVSIPGYPGYAFNLDTRSVVSLRTKNRRHGYGRAVELTTYTNTKGEKFVQILDYNNCRKRVTISTIENLIKESIEKDNNAKSVSINPNNVNSIYRTDYIDENIYNCNMDSCVKMDFSNCISGIIPRMIKYY